MNSVKKVARGALYVATGTAIAAFFVFVGTLGMATYGDIRGLWP